MSDPKPSDKSKLRQLLESESKSTPPTESELSDDLRDLAEEIVRYCPSLTQFLLSLGEGAEPGEGLN